MNCLPDFKKKDEWFYDSYTENAGLAIRVKKKIIEKKTEHQLVKIYDTYEFGKMLVLNGYMYQAEKGIELTEMLVHVPFNSGKLKEKILLIGGGDGVSLREVVKYSSVKEIHVVDIDEELTNLCKKHFISSKEAWKDNRVTYHFKDGFDFLRSSNEKYDVILSAVSEIYNEDGSPGMAYPLYTKEFYSLAFDHLTAEGMFVADGTTVHYTSEGYEWWEYAKDMSKIFPIVRPYIFNSKRMPGGDFVLLFCSKKYDPVKDFNWRGAKLKIGYYNQEIHGASFVLPEHLKRKLP